MIVVSELLLLAVLLCLIVQAARPDKELERVRAAARRPGVRKAGRKNRDGGKA